MLGTSPRPGSPLLCGTARRSIGAAGALARATIAVSLAGIAMKLRQVRDLVRHTTNAAGALVKCGFARTYDRASVGQARIERDLPHQGRRTAIGGEQVGVEDGAAVAKRAEEILFGRLVDALTFANARGK